LAPASAHFNPVGLDLGLPPATSALALPLNDVSDPGVVGPYAVTAQEYDFGNAAYVPPQFASLSGTKTVELTASVHAPTDLSAGPFPLVVLLHGNHYSNYSGTTAYYEWPFRPGSLPIPNYRGYDYFANVLASHGYIVVSLSANGVNVLGNNFGDTGMLARAQLIQRHLDIWNDLNRDGVVHGLPGGDQSPFGTRFVGKVNLQDVGLMGHSRGGEGAVRSYLYNQSLGSPYGIKAVFALAPVDFTSPRVNNVPFAVLLPYNDGDVYDLEGVSFYDDSRYNVPGDTGPKYTILVMGADHNYYNTVWSPGGGYPGASDDGYGGPPTRLTQAQQRGTGLAYMSAFFRTYLGGEAQFMPILTGDEAPPPSAQVSSGQIHLAYLPPDDLAHRRDVNRLSTPANLTTNTLGGAALSGGLSTYSIVTSASGEPDSGLSQLNVGYQNTLTAFYENDLPAGARDERGYNDLQFRIGVSYTDTRNPRNVDQDFSVELVDGAGHSQSALVSAYSNDLYYPPQNSNPHEVLNTVRIPLSAFPGIDLSDVRALRFDFNQHNSGAFQIAEIAFADPTVSAGPYVLASAPAGGAFAPQSNVRVRFDRAIDVSTFTTASVDRFTRTVGSTVTDLRPAITGVTPVAGTNNTQFDISFAEQTALGAYSLVIGPDIRDLAGHPMDQNHNLIAGEVPDDEYTAAFSIQGPKVVASSPSGTNHLPAELIGSVTLTFNEPIDPPTFTPDKVFAFRGPSGFLPITAVTPVAGSNDTQFNVQFVPQPATGRYTMLVGPDIRDFAGHRMDQNGNFVDGEFPGDAYGATFGIQGLQVASAALNATLPNQAHSVHLTFNEPVDPTRFSPAAVALTGPDGDHPAIGVVPAAGGTPYTQFDVLFAPLTAAGAYGLVVGPNVYDPYGNAMDQDGDLVPGEDSDAYTTSFTLAAPRVLSSSPTGTVEPVVDHVRLTFDRSMDPSSFSADQASLTGPDGSAVAVTGVTAVPFSSDLQFDVTFAPQSLPGGYSLALHGGADFYGNPLGDYTAQFTLAAFRVLSTTPSGTVARNTDHVRVTFDRPVDPPTFGTDQVTLTGPAGPVPVTAVEAVGGSNDTQFDVRFAPLSAAGTYALALSTDVHDLYGNALSAYTATLTIVNVPAPTHNYELRGTYADSLGGPAIVPAGGTLGPNGYTFGPDQGPSLSGAINPATYSIEMRFRIDDNSGYVKLLDFNDRSADEGLYNLGGALTFYGAGASGPDGALTAGVVHDLVVTRDGATNQFVAYLDGVRQFAFTDTGPALATFSGPNNIIHFLRDDLVTGGLESSAGALERVRIYNSVLTAEQVAAIFAEGPTPATGG
jgi:hypothetical protein